jgi:4-hydroxy-tetrahydrodipicolinate synthase
MVNTAEDYLERPEPRGTVNLPPAGVVVPMVTPLLPDGSPDLESLDRLTGHLLGAGVVGLLVLGSTGENSALSAAQRVVVAERSISAVRGRAHVMIGVPALGTRDAVTDARRYAALGADSLLQSAPFGFQLSQKELADHLRLVASSVDIPLVAYNVPSRVQVVLEPGLLAQLAFERVIRGVKDSSGDLPKARVFCELTRDIPDFFRYTGTEQSIDSALLGGFHATMPGLANVFPDFHVELARRAASGDWAGAAAVQGSIVKLLELYDGHMAEASFTAHFFAVVKEALVQQGIIAHNTSAAPFSQADERVRRHVAAALDRAREIRALEMRP